MEQKKFENKKTVKKKNNLKKKWVKRKQKSKKRDLGDLRKICWQICRGGWW